MKHLTVLALSLALLSACGKQDATPPPAPGSSDTPSGPRPEKIANGEPAVITVEHVLIGFKETMPKSNRTKDEARKLAYEVLNRAKSGEDFTKLRKELSDDNATPDAGVYTLVNNGVAKQGSGEYERTGMVPAFGDVGFVLNVTEIGLAEHDSQKSPYGWHIIKRIK